MDIVCDITDKTTINCDYPFYEEIDMGNGNIGYVSTLWTGGDVLISFFLFTIIIFLISKELFRFFFPVVIKIKRKLD